MSYLKGVDREQRMLLPETVEDYVGEENPVRVVDLFVAGLNLRELGFEVKAEQAPGAPPYEPKALLKLLLYGYLNRVRSSRELEKATRRNLEVIWLLGRLTPDHWTINQFRRVHRARFKEVFRRFNLVCGSLGLFGAELVAIDGTFLKAVNSPQRNFSQAKVRQLLERIDARTEAYLQALESAEREVSGQALAGGQQKGESLQDKLKTLQQKRQACEEMLQQLEAAPGTQISTTDPDSRSLCKRSERTVGYNAQIAVDSAQHLIVAQEVTQEPNDTGLLEPMARAARDELQVEKLRVVADRGYYSHEQVLGCEQHGIEAYVPEAKRAPAGEGLYPFACFRHEAERDVYVCPQGRTLHRHADTTKASGLYRVYYDVAACRDCPVRAQCTRGAYRKVTVHEHHERLTAVRTRLVERPEIVAKRHTLVEHPFGTLKFWLGYRSFLCRGLEMVRAEFSLSCLAYNFRRALNLLGVPKLLRALAA